MKTQFIRSKRVREWPDLDTALWQSAITIDPLAPGGGGGGRGWRPGTRRFTAVSYGVWLAWLDSQGLLDPGMPPADRATVERVRAYLSAMTSAGLADNTRAGRLQGLADALRVMTPRADISFISRGAGNIRKTAKRSRNIAAQMRPAQDALDLGLELLRAAEQPTGMVPWKKAILYRDGLLIALWSVRPIRVSNLAAIEIGRHLVRQGGGYRLTFEGDEHKNHRHFSCSFPVFLEPMLERYLEHFRPGLEAKRKGQVRTDALWLSQFGRPMLTGSVTQMINLRTLKSFGRRMGPHMQRHNVGSDYAVAASDRIADVAAMLGHASLETSKKHYIHAKSMNAGHALAKAILTYRKA